MVLMSSLLPNERKEESLTMVKRTIVLLIVGLSLVALLFGACGAPKSTGVEPIAIWASPAAAVPMAVADGEGFFEEQGLNIDLRVTQEDEPPFLAGQTPISSVSAWDAAEYRLQGEDVMIVGIGGGTRFFNGIAVRPDSSYSSWPQRSCFKTR